MVTEVIRKALLYGDRAPRKSPTAAREVIVVKMNNPGARGIPIPPEFDHVNHALVVYWLTLRPLDNAVKADMPKLAKRRALLRSTN